MDLVTPDMMTASGIAGVLVTIATALVTRATFIPSKVRQWVPFVFAGVAVALILWSVYEPISWEQAAGVLGTVYAVSQLVYMTFKQQFKVMSGDLALKAPEFAEANVPAEYNEPVTVDDYVPAEVGEVDETLEKEDQ